MKKLLLIFLVMLLPAGLLTAQNVTEAWVNNWDYANYSQYMYNGWSDINSGLDVDAYGNTYVTGYTYNESGYSDVFVIKYDPDGNLVYEDQFDAEYEYGGYGGYCYDYGVAINVDDEGNAYVGTSHQIYNYMLGWIYPMGALKVDPSGNLVWKKVYDDYLYNNQNEYAANLYLVEGAAEYFYIGGYINYYSYEDFLVRQIDPSTGESNWVGIYDSGAYDYCLSLTPDDAGNVYACGQSYSFENNNYDFTVVKFDATDGTQDWVTKWDSGGDDNINVNCSVLTEDGGVIVAGCSYPQSPEVISNYAASNYADYAIIKINSEGGIDWTNVSDLTGNDWEDYPYSVGLDFDGNVYVSGETYDPDYGYADVLLAKYDTEGILVWANTYDRGDYDYSTVLDISTSDRVIYLATQSYNDGGGGGNGYTGYDIWTQGIDLDGSRLWEMVYATDYDERPCDIALDPSGNVIVAGNSYSPSTNQDVVTIKYNVEYELTVRSPNGGEEWATHSTKTILWWRGTSDFVNLYLSTDSGSTWTILAEEIDNSGSYDWAVPEIFTTTARIRVEATDTGEFDDSDADFSIVSPFQIDMEVQNPFVARGGKLMYDLTFTNIGDNTETFKFWTKLKLPNGTFYPGYVVPPFTMTLKSGASKHYVVTHTIPKTFAIGEYWYYGFVGPSAPTSIWDSDNFNFVVMPFDKK